MTMRTPEARRRPFVSFTRMALGASAIALLSAATGCATVAPPAAAPQAGLPPALEPAQGEVPDGVLHAQGDMRYICARKASVAVVPQSASPDTPPGDSVSTTWKPVGTLARLLDDEGRVVALVTPEGYYTAYDGSYVVAHVTDVVQPDPQALPWTREAIRFTAASAQGDGRFAKTAAIVRAHTIGGLAPAEACDQEGASLAVPYFASYLIYPSV